MNFIALTYISVVTLISLIYLAAKVATAKTRIVMTFYFSIICLTIVLGVCDCFLWLNFSLF